MFDSLLDSDLTDTSALAGLPQDRAARLAARKAFVDMKQLFMQAVAPLADPKGQWLQQQVRQSNQPLHLWLLRGPVLAALKQDERNNREVRAQLYKGLDTVFPEAFGFDHSLTPLSMPQPWEVAQAMAMSPQARA